jgi:hypothetical protein
MISVLKFNKTKLLILQKFYSTFNLILFGSGNKTNQNDQQDFQTSFFLHIENTSKIILLIQQLFDYY